MKEFSSVLVFVTAGYCLQAAQLPIDLGSAGTFSVLASSTVTNTGPTAVSGDVGLSPGTSITGFPPGTVTNGALHAHDNPAASAQSALTLAYNDAAGRLLPTPIIGNLGNQTLTPGLYSATSSQGLTGILTLNGQGNPNSVFIFQIGSTLDTANNSQVLLTNGAQAANIFWQVGSSATLGTNSFFNGTILAQVSITLTTGAAMSGRALARTGAVTLDTNTIVNPGPPTTSGSPGTLTVTCPLNAAQSGVTYNSVLVSTGGTPPYTFSITGSLPPGLFLSTSTGAVTGTPMSGGINYPFTTNVTDSLSGRASSSCSIFSALPAPSPTPAPSSLILVLIGLAFIAVYVTSRSLRRA